MLLFKKIVYREILLVNFVSFNFKVLVSGTNLHNIKCFYATIYLVEPNKPIFNHLCILNDDVTPEIWKSVMIKLLNPT